MKSPRISIGLDPYTIKMIEAAERVLVKNKASFRPSEPRDENPRWRTWFCKWAIMVVARAVAKAGTLPIPLGVELRPETREETNKRTGRKNFAGACAKAVAAVKAEADTHRRVKARFKWTPENLN